MKSESTSERRFPHCHVLICGSRRDALRTRMETALSAKAACLWRGNRRNPPMSRRTWWRTAMKEALERLSSSCTLRATRDTSEMIKLSKQCKRKARRNGNYGNVFYGNPAEKDGGRTFKSLLGLFRSSSTTHFLWREQRNQNKITFCKTYFVCTINI